MRKDPVPYSMIVQAGPEEILRAPTPHALNLATLQNWPSIQNILVALPDLEGSEKARKKLQQWGFSSFVGDPYNVCNRIIAGYEQLPPQDFAVRVLAIWKDVDLDYVDCLVAQMHERPCDLMAAPKDFDITMAADVAALSAIRLIGQLEGDSQEVMRAKFNPWGYMEMHQDQFCVSYLEPAPLYDRKKVQEILSRPRCHPENEFFGRDYSGSHYHFIAQQIPAGMRILDIACGSGFGSELLSKTASLVIGVDYSEAYIENARQRYPENPKLQFLVADAQNFLYRNLPEQFDLVTSFHTLEHVPDDKAMMTALYRNLLPGGILIAEVPLLCKRPLGIAINPYHLREYTQEQFIKLIEATGFEIVKLWGSCRSIYGTSKQAREALQIHARKLL